MPAVGASVRPENSADGYAHHCKQSLAAKVEIIVFHLQTTKVSADLCVRVAVFESFTVNANTPCNVF